MTTSTDQQRYVVTRTISASPAQVFAVLADPARHCDTEPGDWVRDAIDPEPITGTGQIFAVNVFLRDGDTVYRTWHTNGRGTEQLSHSFALIDLLPYGRQEEWLDSPEGWPSRPTYSGWLDSPDIARLYGKDPR